MELVIDNRLIKSLYTDRENNHYAESDKITKLVCNNKTSIIELICKLIFIDKDIKDKEFNFITELYNFCIINKKNELNRKSILEFISEKDKVSIRTLERYINKFISYGILSKSDKTISFTKYYNPMNIKFPTTNFIVIEVNPNITSNKITID